MFFDIGQKRYPLQESVEILHSINTVMYLYYSGVTQCIINMACQQIINQNNYHRNPGHKPTHTPPWHLLANEYSCVIKVTHFIVAYNLGLSKCRFAL